MSSEQTSAAKAYEQFGRWVAEIICDGDSFLCDLDGADAGDKLLELGILIETSYDPDKHGEFEFYVDPEPGDTIQVFNEGMQPHAK